MEEKNQARNLFLGKGAALGLTLKKLWCMGHPNQQDFKIRRKVTAINRCFYKSSGE